MSLTSSSIGGFEPVGQPPQLMLDLIGAVQQGDLDQTNELDARIWLDGPQRTSAQTSPDLGERVREFLP